MKEMRQGVGPLPWPLNSGKGVGPLGKQMFLKGGRLQIALQRSHSRDQSFDRKYLSSL